MGLRDAKLIFCDAVAVTTDAVTSDLNLGDIDEPGAGHQLFVNIYLDTAFSSDTETLQIDLITSSGVPTAGNVLMTLLPATAVSALGTAGLLVKTALPSEGLEQYIGLSLVVDDAAIADGKITAFLTEI
jgi:hypothetical protein